MKKINTWLEKNKLKNFPALIVVVTFVVFIIMIISFLNHNDEDSSSIYVIEDAELRTGPSSAYPVISNIDKGQNFQKIGKTGKWLEVESANKKEKGWVAGWHTNLDIDRKSVV